MNKLPTKQIYLLFIIIVGIIALSVYSTYALFTFESSTSDIVSIHIPKSLTISENIYEYQQITVEPNSIATTDIDIYNSFQYEVCYSVWYKVVGEQEIQNNVQVFEKKDKTLTSSGVLDADKHLRVTLVIVNDNDTEIKINLGTIGSAKKEESCSLNISSDKNVVTISYENLDVLATKLLEDTKTTKEEENYLTYKDVKEVITYKKTDKIYFSNEFTYTKEIFTLTESEYLTFEEVMIKNNMKNEDIYICKENSECNILYKFTMQDITVLEDGYQINRYDKLLGYSSGTNGLRKVNNKDYVYYGDNPNNFIYYNCSNNDDLSTCELWRIIGFFYNTETKRYVTKIIRNNSINLYQYDYKMEEEENKSSNNWNTSTLNKYLNEEYKLKNNNDILLEEYKQPLEVIPDLEIDIKKMQDSELETNSQITILSISDFINASSCVKQKLNEYTGVCLTDNWLNNVEINKEWTMTSKEVIEPVEEIEEEEIIPEEIEPEEDLEEPTEELEENDESTEPVEENNYIINYVYLAGGNILESDVNEFNNIRPTVFLKSRIILLGGTGTLESPYIIK